MAELAGSPPVSADLIKTRSGFINPHDEKDMQLTLENGLVFICVENEKVVAYNRYVTQADAVFHELCRELKIDQALRKFSFDSFSDWSGNGRAKSGKTLKQVCWTDRSQALLAFNAALAGLENRQSGRLAWNVDSAVHPESRKRGIPKAILDYSRSGPLAEFGYRCFRIFEICQINGRKVSVENTRSKNTFIRTTTRQFAYTEEEIVINSDITLEVKWNYWLTPS